MNNGCTREMPSRHYRPRAFIVTGGLPVFLKFYRFADDHGCVRGAEPPENRGNAHGNHQKNGPCHVVGAANEGPVKVAANLRKMTCKMRIMAVYRGISPRAAEWNGPQLARFSGICINQRQWLAVRSAAFSRRAWAMHGALAACSIATHIINVIRRRFDACGHHLMGILNS